MSPVEITILFFPVTKWVTAVSQKKKKKKIIFYFVRDLQFFSHINNTATITLLL